MMYCENCGYEINDLVEMPIFCSECSNMDIVSYGKCESCGHDNFTINNHQSAYDRLKQTITNAIDEVISEDEDEEEDSKQNDCGCGGNCGEECECEEKSLLDYIHHCVDCGDVALALSENEYQCVSCGCVWSVKRINV